MIQSIPARVSKGAQARAAKVNPVATEYQLGCIRRHFARIQRGFPNRYSELAQRGRTKKSKPGYRPKPSQIASMLRGADVIDLFVRRGIRLNSKKVYRKPLVAGIKQSLFDLTKKVKR